MGYVLLWLENLALWILLFMLGIAVTSRLQRRFLRRLVGVGLMVLPVVLLLVPLALFGLLEFRGPVHARLGLFWPFAALTISVFVGGVLVVRSAARRNEAQVPAAQRWNLANLSVVWVVALMLHLMTLWNLDLAVRQQMDVLRAEAAGLAMSVLPPPVTDRENAASLYQQAFDAGIVGPKPANYEKWLDAIHQNPATFTAEDPEFVEYVRRQQPALVLVREAAKLPTCSFPRDWGRPSFSLLLPETQNMRGAARDLELDARYLANHGNLPGALHNVLALYQVAEHVGQEPLLISQLVSFAIHSMATGELEFLLRTYPVTDQDLDLFNAWRPIAIGPRLQRAFRVEEAFGLSTFCQIGEWRDMEENGGVIGLQGWGPNVSLFYRVFLFSDDIKSYRHAMARAERAAALPFAERQKEFDRIELSLRTTPMGIVTRLLMPALTNASIAATRVDAQGRLVQLALAVHRYRIQHGDFPDSLETLARAGIGLIPRDPHDGNPLRMVSQGERLVLYSVGPDGTDNLGAPYDSAAKTGDITFILRGDNGPVEKRSP